MKTAHSSQLWYLYPPFVATILSWFLTLDGEILKNCWLAFSFLSLSGGVYYLSGALAGGKIVHSPWLSVATLAILVFPPAFNGISLGQVDAVIFLLLSITAWGFVTNRQVTAGSAIAVAGAIKASPWILVLLLFRFRYERGKLAFVLMTLLCALISCSTPRGYQVIFDYMSAAAPLASGSTGWITENNYSLPRLIHGLLPFLRISQATIIGQVIVFGLLVALFFARTSSRSDNKLILLSALICLMVLAPPIIWFHHLLWLIIPAFTVMKLSPCSFSTSFTSWCALGLLSISFLIDKYLQQEGIDPLLQIIVGPSMVVLPILTLYFMLVSKLRVIA